MDILGNIMLLIAGSIFAFFSQKKLNTHKAKAVLEIDVYVELIHLLNDYKNEVTEVYELSNRYFSQQEITKQEEEHLKRLLSENKIPPHIFKIALLKEIIIMNNKKYDDMYEGSKSLFKMLGYRINNYSEYNQHEPSLYSNKAVENCYIEHQKSIKSLLNELQEILDNK
ncbi:MAG: hypothetical protein WBA84_01985 [Carnobacterium sp.]|uniref:hypothetical protein n=1 Tax=Carnobacterium sp. TaxID=48221 RepID=UPI003C72FDA0